MLLAYREAGSQLTEQSNAGRSTDEHSIRGTRWACRSALVGDPHPSRSTRSRNLRALCRSPALVAYSCPTHPRDDEAEHPDPYGDPQQAIRIEGQWVAGLCLDRREDTYGDKPEPDDCHNGVHNMVAKFQRTVDTVPEVVDGATTGDLLDADYPRVGLRVRDRSVTDDMQLEQVTGVEM